MVFLIGACCVVFLLATIPAWGPMLFGVLRLAVALVILASAALYLLAVGPEGRSNVTLMLAWVGLLIGAVLVARRVLRFAQDPAKMHALGRRLRTVRWW